MRGIQSAPVRVDPPGSGLNSIGWHAVELAWPTAGAEPATGLGVCGQVVTVADKYPVFDRARRPDRTCPQCAWLVALRAGGRVLAAEIKRLREPGSGELAVRVAERVLATNPYDPALDGDPDGRLVALLSAVSGHVPRPLIDADCAEGCCDHHGQDCPTIGWACSACSLLSGSWAGEWEGRYLDECTITAPCQVLRTLAAHHHHHLPPTPAGSASPTVGARS